jgi:sugar O-acyltransferase (sialic acid O-acetyltransferase NeuD family)
MKKKLYIVGAGSVGKHLAANINEYTNESELSGFFDDDPKKIGQEYFGCPVIGKTDRVNELVNIAITLGIAFPKVKAELVKSFVQNQTLSLPAFIHPSAWVSKGVLIGEGSIIYPGSMINYGSKISRFVVMNMNCSIGHHTVIGDYSSLAPGVNTGGHTIIGERVDLGIGASTIQNIEIGDDSIVGGQSMIIKNIRPGTTVAGVPGKAI